MILHAIVTLPLTKHPRRVRRGDGEEVEFVRREEGPMNKNDDRISSVSYVPFSYTKKSSEYRGNAVVSEDIKHVGEHAHRLTELQNNNLIWTGSCLFFQDWFKV